MPGPRDRPGTATWFRDAFGFDEEQQSGTHGQQKHAGQCGDERMRALFETTRFHFEVSDCELRRKADGKRLGGIGKFELPTLQELHRRAEEAKQEPPDSYWSAGELTFQNAIGETYDLYQDPANAGAVFQVASLFNCLETSPPGASPEDGIERYGKEATQGPASAVACPAATAFRNYLVNGIGQSKDSQLDCMAEIGKLVNNEQEGYWTMRSGYCMPRAPGTIARLSVKLSGDPALAKQIPSKLCVGIHWDAEVATGSHSVSQVFCSALPVGICKSASSGEWQTFACILLVAAYDATLSAAALIAAQRGERVRVFLTTVGGGVLGNRQPWIADAMDCAMSAHKMDPLDVILVHFGRVPTSGPYVALESGRQPVEICPVSPKAAVKPPGPEEISRQLAQLKQRIGRQGSVSLENVDDAFRRFDTDGDGTIDAEELSDLEKWNREHAMNVAHVFACFDANGDGVIDRREFLDIMQKVDPEFFTPRTINILLEEADADGDGVVHYTEFFAWLYGEDPMILGRVLHTTFL
eukprot:CAMPEP_0204243558 /NCGR_PEP_ID=MMETSP0361-20130328/96472_1 /ASSEMBLY_ACC=CAM_ASM_000343 /TAXON_ID=268821 /ORGANISM="Scrippsiella Hangoei, Strain SHTV-5" /LENGTH=525 /DNA_ID=CAMNT_0051216413 /DNA_START=51 /DNA_END=1625 /DNA_ORIENTATION=-